MVVVPARDEEELIGGCIRALAAQRGVDPERWRVILVLDGCRDETRALALAAAAEGGPEVELLELEPVGVGAARARGMDLGCTLLERAGNPSGLIATTDADSRVAPDWLVRQLAAIAEGARAIGGRVALEAADATFLGDATISRRRREHEERIARVRGQGPTEHPHFAGASIGITADAYRAIGGFEPLAALEDEDLGRRLSAGGVTIHRLDSVRVTTSGRTSGRAPRGLARDLAVSEWHSRRTFDGFAYDVAEVARARDRSVSVIVPAKDCAETIGPIVSALDALREAGLLDELIVVDADSADGTAERAAEAGAEVLSESALLPRLGPCRGKGDAMYRAASSCSGELIAFVDADTAGFDSTLLSGLLGPVLEDPSLRLVKGAFRRPFSGPAEVIEDGGGRVTELVARPLLNLHFPELAGFEQPLAGEMVIERSLFEELSVPVGYGVEIAMLIDAWRLAGMDALAQCRLGERRNRHQPLRSLSRMAYEVTVAVQRRVEGMPEPLLGPLLAGGEPGEVLRPACEERPPLALASLKAR